MDFNLEAVIGVGAAPAIIYAVTQNIKSAWRYINDITARDSFGKPVESSPWPLVSSVVGALWMLGAWYSGWLPQEQLDSPLAAVMLGIGAGAATSKTYEVIKR